MHVENETFGMKEIPNIKIDLYKDDKFCETIIVDDCKDYSYLTSESYEQVIFNCCIVEKNLWEYLISNAGFSDYDYFKITATTYIRSAKTGKDEAIVLLNHRRFDNVDVSFDLQAEGDPATPEFVFYNKRTITKEKEQCTNEN